jgi:tetratricopeptide (TPR) repeat protein
VRYVLEGSVRKADNRVRITAQLVDTTTGHHLWAERYDRDLKDIFALQDDITQQIVAALEVKLTTEEQEQVWRRYTDNVEAYDYLLRGAEYLNRFTQETNVQARQMFEKALELDPEFTAAYAALSLTHFREWGLQWSQDPQALERAFALAQKAVALDDSLPLAHMVLSHAYQWRKQPERAIAEGERVIALDPNNADSHVHLAEILNFAGRSEEAMGLVEKAMRLNPYYPYVYLYHLGFAYAATRQYEEAIAALKRVLTRNPDFLPAHLLLAAVYGESGQEEEARAEAAEILRLNPHFSLEVVRQTVPYKDQARLERFLAALRQAGLK